MRMKSLPSEFTKYQQPLSFSSPPLFPPAFSLSLDPLVYYNSFIKEQWPSERPPNHSDISTIGRVEGRRGDYAEVWKPSITEGLKLTSQQDMCIRMQIWADYGQQMPSGAVKRAAHMQCGTLPRNLQKNGKLSWMMIVAVAEKGHCVERTGIMALNCAKNPQ